MPRSLALTLVACLASGLVCAGTTNVTNTNDSGPGSLRTAIESLNTNGGGVITFDGGFPFEGVISLASPLPAFTAAQAEVSGGDRAPRIDGNSLHRIFRASASTTQLVLSDLMLQNGRAGTDEGGCVHGASAANGSLFLTRMAFTGCVVEQTSLAHGGAVRWDRFTGVVRVDDSFFSMNSVTATASNGQSSGGAVYSFTDVSINRSRFIQNAAAAPNGANALSAGGAVSQRAGSGTILDSEFEGNTTLPNSGFASGGAVYLGCAGCDLRIGRSAFRGNVSIDGAAIGTRQTDAGEKPFLAVVNSSFYENDATNNGGSIYTESSVLEVRNTSHYDNAASSGAHVWLGFGTDLVLFGANLLAPTFAGPACGAAIGNVGGASVGQNYFADASCSLLANNALPAGPLGTILYDETPGLPPVLRFSGSGVIDSIAGAGSCEPEDARGTSRPQDGDGDGVAQCDVGAFESPEQQLFADGFEG